MSTPRCTVCKRAVMCGQGTRHLVCSPVCDRCHLAITSKDGDAHDHCKTTTSDEEHA